MALPAKTSHDVLVLQAPTTAAGVIVEDFGSSVRMARPHRGFTFVLDVTAAATSMNDGVSVYVQTRIDDGSGEANWFDVVRFSTVLGNGGAKQHVERIASNSTEAGFSTGTALAAGTVRHIMGDEWRVKWATQELFDASFTFGVSACPL